MSLYNDVTALLKEIGYTFSRQGKGSHEIWCKEGRNCVTVPSNLKSRHTGNKALKEAGSKKKI